jgi:GNAT superfamily N-acetyltransferase
VSIAVRRAARDDYPKLAAIVNAVTPEAPTTAENLAWQDTTYPGGARLLAELDGRTVGAGTVGRIFMLAPDFDAFWGSIEVLPDARRRGVGSALFAAIGGVARDAGKTHLHMPASTSRPESIAWLEHRGFVEYDRWKIVELDLADLTPPPVEAPPGVEITSLEDRPDLVEAVHRVALEAFPDIPTGGEPMAAGTLDEFRARDVDRAGIPPGGFAVALDEATGDAIGFASIMFLPGSTTRAYHDMTAVRRVWRGCGVGRALKQATIAWAVRSGLESLETGNEEANAPMRALNARLGYRARPDELTLRGRLPDAEAGP